MVEILDQSGIRIGNQQYTRQNGTFGLSTLRRKHLIEGRELVFQYKGKSKKEQNVTIEDPALIKHIQEVAQLPGYEIFRYRDENGNLQNVDSQDVNQYLAEIMGEGFTSKDFRTWVGSRLALELFPAALQLKEEEPRQKLDNILIRLVADELGNTPTVCRGYYVHPLLLRKIEAGEIPRHNPFRDSDKAHGHTASEKLLIKLLKA
jgi:DNA topoisomerase-1